MPDDDMNPNGRHISRRQFLKGAAVAGAGTALAGGLIAPDEADAQTTLQEPPRGKTLRRGPVRVTLQVNGKPVTMEVEPRTTLLNALRNHANPPITGPKPVCEQGSCGACTVLVDGKTAYSCILLAVDMVGKQITTVEGLSDGQALTPLQDAFVEDDALMCGFCTPGFVMSISALLREKPNATEADVRKACQGNLCRCGTYPRVFQAALNAARKGEGGA